LTIKKEEVGKHYPTCFYAIIANASATICGAIVLRLYLVRENRRRDHEFGPVNSSTAREVGFKDETDRENENFRYSL
jgi:hypothetical protein